MQRNGSARRQYGTGSIIEKNGSYHGKWWVNGNQRWKALGRVRQPGSTAGLTRKQAEAKLRAVMAEHRAAPPSERIGIEEAGKRLLQRLEALDRKRATVESYESILRVHLVPFFGSKPLSHVTVADIEHFMGVCRAAGCAPKSTLNYLGVLHSIFDLGVRRGWVDSNPCKLVDKPTAGDTDADVRFLTNEEVFALIAAVPDDDLGRVERVMYLAAAMTGMRQGELLALRWQDIDWSAQRVRVRRNFVRGEFGTPKSKRSSRSIPLADRLEGELDLLYRQTAYKDDLELVFAHPNTGKPIDRSKLLKRYKAALRRAGVREARFHDLRHTFGTRMAAAGVPMRTLQEFMGHRDFKTTLIYADYAPGENEANMVNAAFAPAPTNPSTDLRPTQAVSHRVQSVVSGETR
jgi:integrase